MIYLGMFIVWVLVAYYLTYNAKIWYYRRELGLAKYALKTAKELAEEYKQQRNQAVTQVIHYRNFKLKVDAMIARKRNSSRT